MNEATVGGSMRPIGPVRRTCLDFSRCLLALGAAGHDRFGRAARLPLGGLAVFFVRARP
jgi:hypothetical protein